MTTRLHALLLISAFASCWRVLFTFFGVDDFSYVRLTIFPWPGWVQVFALRYFADYVLFAWHRMLFGLDPVWFHATLVGLHLLNTWLVLTLLPKLGVRRRPDAIIAAFVFALHPTTYTVLNWAALGFEEFGVVALTLVVLHLFTAYMARPRIWLLAAAPVLMFIACGFKNLATLIPAWIAAAAAIIVFEQPSPEANTTATTTARGTLLRRAIFVILPTVLVTLWYAIVVAPSVPQLQAEAVPAYARDFSPSSVTRGFSVLMANLLNPLFVVRIGTGYQESVPAAIAQWAPDGRHALAAAIVAIVLIVWTIACWRTRRFVFGAAMLMVMIAALAPYSIMPLHLNDYATWPLPASAALWGITFAEAYRYLREKSPRIADALSRPPMQAAGAALLVAYAWVSGATLYGSNLFVRQARNAELIDGAARRASDGARILFVPPSGLPYTDTTYSQSVLMLHPEKRLRVEYVAAPGESSAAAATAIEASAVEASAAGQPGGVVPLLLDAVPHGAGERPRLYAIERAHWAASGHTRIERGRTLIQPFSTGAGRVREIHLLLIAFSERCALKVDVFRNASGVSDVSGASTAVAAAPERVAGGVMSCRGQTVTGYRSVVLDQPLAPNTDYALHVTATPNDPPPDGIRHGPIADGGWAPFRFDNDATNSTDTLAIRLIGDSWQ